MILPREDLDTSMPRAISLTLVTRDMLTILRTWSMVVRAILDRSHMPAARFRTACSLLRARARHLFELISIEKQLSESLITSTSIIR